MNNNELKEKIKKNLKEEIAISNIKNDCLCCKVRVRSRFSRMGGGKDGTT